MLEKFPIEGKQNHLRFRFRVLPKTEFYYQDLVAISVKRPRNEVSEDFNCSYLHGLIEKQF